MGPARDIVRATAAVSEVSRAPGACRMSGRHRVGAELLWLQSPWDHRVHAFRVMGEIASEAICSHCAPSARLTEPLPGAKQCLACLMIHGRDLADRHGNSDTDWSM